MNKIIEWLSKLGKDKIFLFCICFLISAITACIIKVCGGEKYVVLAGAWFAGFIAGVAKELYDEWKYKGADSADWLADILGTTLGTLLAYILVN